MSTVILTGTLDVTPEMRYTQTGTDKPTPQQSPDDRCPIEASPEWMADISFKEWRTPPGYEEEVDHYLMRCSGIE